MPFFTSIRAKATLLFFLLFVGIMLPLNWIIYNQIKETLIDASRKEMKFESEKLFQLVKLDPPTVPLATNYELQLRFQGEFIDDVIFSSPEFGTGMLDTEAEYYTTDTLEIFNARRSENNGVLILSLARSNESITQRLADLKFYLFTASSVSIAIAGVLVFLAAGWMLKPFLEISKTANQIQASNNIVRVPVPNTTDESHVLAKAINEMLARIELSIQTQINFFASATHELKTPLAIMKADLSSFKDRQDEKINGLLFEVERLDRVISDFLLISQLKSDSLALRKKQEPIDELLYRALKKLKYIHAHPEPSVNFQFENQHTNSCANVDSDKIETVFINLLENAARYAHPKSIAVVLGTSDNDVRVQISNPIREAIDDGQLVIREFNKSRELSAGLGMGLWICQEILRLHNGTLELSSDKATFKATVILPLE
jgi:signal transduction histidine kinase